MNNKGFTLVELLAVIIIIGLLFSIAIPSTVSISKKVKNRSYSTKIDLIEEGAESYGQANVTALKQSKIYCCDTKNISGFTTNVSTVASSSIKCNEDDYSYPCIKINVQDLINSSNLDTDEILTNNGERMGVSINPVDDNIINYCQIYVYYKYKRVYAFFDKDNCSNVASSLDEAESKGYSFSSGLLN